MRGKRVSDHSVIVNVVERPSIAEINIEGNSQISDDDLRTGLADAGLAEGQEDVRYTGDITITKRDLSFAGFAPQLLYHYERVVSNAAFDDIEKHEIEMRLTRDF